jgi:V-type H+-transporting ATPase subunit C
VLDNDEERLASYKMVNDSQCIHSLPGACQPGFLTACYALPQVLVLSDSTCSKTEPTEQYLRTFTWNKIRYRSDKSLGELIDTLQKVPYSIHLLIKTAWLKLDMTRNWSRSTMTSKLNLASTTVSSQILPPCNGAKRETCPPT